MKLSRPLLVEIALVAGMVAALIAMGFVNLATARRAKNEHNARLLLRIFHQAEENFRNEVQSDRDTDEKGEFGTLGELLGMTETESGRQFNIFDISTLPDKQKAVLEELRQPLGMPEISAAIKEKPKAQAGPKPSSSAKKKKNKAKGPPKNLYESPIFNRQTQELVFDGFVFRLFLPQLAQSRKDLTEEEKVATFTDETEQYWCAFAWPYRHGRTGQNCYFIDFRGELYTREDPSFSGLGRTDLRAIEAYEGREFETAVSKKIWTPWLQIEAAAQKPPDEPAKPADAEKAASPEGETPQEKTEQPEGETPQEGTPATEGETPKGENSDSSSETPDPKKSENQKP